ncbi:MAG: hypothetical protein CMJ84_16730 [Planctomycetes bacterium]|jgi:hypothetical protein|nr:hypothetical protein [Planctomycetota bacterium]MDP6410797.1 polymer-forming cytoskeletal protein [Planctomycetota bacterium]
MSEPTVDTSPDTANEDPGWAGTCLKLAGCGCLAAVLLCVFSVWLVDRWIPFLDHEWTVTETMRVREDQVFDDSLVFVGQDLFVDGALDGDLTMIGEKLEVDGTIHGDVAFMGKRLRLFGTIDGDLRFLGEKCTIEGRISGDVDFAGERLTLGPKGVVEGDLDLAGETFENAGTVGGSISGVYGD